MKILIAGGGETASLVATRLIREGNEVVLFEISKKSIDDLLENKDFRNEFIGFLMKKQRYLAERILYLSAMDVEERFFRFLLENYGEKNTYTITLSKKDIASAIGTIPETMSRLIKRLSMKGIITWDENILQIRDGFWMNEFDKLY